MIDAGIIVEDNSLETITYTSDDTVDIKKVGRYTLTYMATDSSGNISTIDRIVNATEWFE